MQLANWFEIAGGLALFLFGIRLMGDGIELMAGAKLKTILEKLTKNRFFGLLVGIAITAIIQSSNATTSMTVGFVNAGLLGLSNSVGLIMGANIGTTVTGQLIAFNMDTIAPLIAFFGIIGFLFIKNNNFKSFAQTITGLGILFIGMATMKQNMVALKNEVWFQTLILSVGDSPILGIIVGIIFTAVVQSASASVGILQAMAGAGIITLGQSIFIICGQNIGATIAAVMTAIGGTRDAKRTACVHVLFNVFATIICVLICSFLPCVEWIEQLSPDSPVQQLANANTLLKIAATVVLYPCATLLEKLSGVIIPEDKQMQDNKNANIHIADKSFGMSSIAISQAQDEVKYMFSLASENVSRVKDALLNPQPGDIDRILDNESKIDTLNRDITVMLVDINRNGLGTHDALLIDQMHHVIVDFERIGDHAENIAGHIKHVRDDEGLNFSEHAREQLTRLFECVEKIVNDSFECMTEHGNVTLKNIEAQEEHIDDLVEELTNDHIKRMEERKCNASIGMIYVEILTDLERIGDHSLNVAQAALKYRKKK